MIGAWIGTLMATLLTVAVAMGCLSLGILFARAPLRGSCGGTGGQCCCDDRNRPCEALEEAG